MLQPPRIVIDPSSAHHTLLSGSALMEGGVFGPGEELRRSPIEITGEREGRGREGGREFGSELEFREMRCAEEVRWATV